LPRVGSRSAPDPKEDTNPGGRDALLQGIARRRTARGPAMLAARAYPGRTDGFQRHAPEAVVPGLSRPCRSPRRGPGRTSSRRAYITRTATASPPWFALATD